MAPRIAVMYLGRVVETGPRDALFGEPRHPYTQALLSAVAVPDPVVERRRERIVLTGDVPSPIDPPSGCRFHTRCPLVMDVCRRLDPPLLDAGGGRSVACHLVHPPSGAANDQGTADAA
jgi:oligopeptide transport system ATP-binding protein